MRERDPRVGRDRDGRADAGTTWNGMPARASASALRRPSEDERIAALETHDRRRAWRA